MNDKKHRDLYNELRVAVLIPAYNEASTISSVVSDFISILPDATIYVYDNNSTDSTAYNAKKSGAIIKQVSYQGKGSVVRTMFSDINADIYVLIDADSTYFAESAPRMIDILLSNSLDMVVGVRVTEDIDSYRFLHKFGNYFLTRTIRLLFNGDMTDVLSGYRIFTRRFVKSFPGISNKFQLEAEFSIHALAQRISYAEFETTYKSRPDNSSSKLNTFRDGASIFLFILTLFRVEKPLVFFGVLSLFSLLISSFIFIPILTEYYHTGLVPRFPSLIMASFGFLLSIILLISGFILDALSIANKERKRLFFLQYDLVEFDKNMND